MVFPAATDGEQHATKRRDVSARTILKDTPASRHESDSRSSWQSFDCDVLKHPRFYREVVAT